MASPFSQAWEILKYFKNPHDEEADANPSFKEKYPNYDLRNLFANRRKQPTEEGTYGGISHREHPLYDVEQGYYDHKRQPPIGVGDDMYHYDDPMHPKNRQPTMERERMIAEMDDPRGVADDILMETPPKRQDPINIFDPKVRAGMMADRMGEIIDEDEKTDDAMESPNQSPVRTIPMSPRGSVRGKGERQAFDKPKKPDWWRTLTGEE